MKLAGPGLSGSDQAHPSPPILTIATGFFAERVWTPNLGLVVLHPISSRFVVLLPITTLRLWERRRRAELLHDGEQIRDTPMLVILPFWTRMASTVSNWIVRPVAGMPRKEPLWVP